eukprot:8368552-Pyramimonas_sp.AAC.1
MSFPRGLHILQLGIILEEDRLVPRPTNLFWSSLKYTNTSLGALGLTNNTGLTPAPIEASTCGLEPLQISWAWYVASNSVAPAMTWIVHSPDNSDEG